MINSLRNEYFPIASKEKYYFEYIEKKAFPNINLFPFYFILSTS